MKKALSLLLAALLLMPLASLSALAEERENEENPLGITAQSAVLMEASTGKILYAHNENEALPPASVTKVMTLLLVMEAIGCGSLDWEDAVTVSAHAASMGGSQIYLKEGETMTVKDLVKSVVIASANDAAVALAEHIAGSEEAFVSAMNERALSLGLTGTHFENTNGLDDTVENHTCSARDIAVMSRELIRYPEILAFSSTWMDTVRDGAFTLTNTNRLVRFYPGATGLKTGSTAKAGFCISATAERDGVSLIAVIMNAESRDTRNAEAKKLLDYGFSHYAVYRDTNEALSSVAVRGGCLESVAVRASAVSFAVPKDALSRVERRLVLPDSLYAPIAAGETVGRVEYYLDGEKLGETPVCAEEQVAPVTFIYVLRRLLAAFCLS